jgi:succinate-semialdehyde dehydrogenase/glutarate-semialdehyde dehydrogenase
MPIASINPTTGETIREFCALTPAQIEEKLALAEQSFQKHRRSSFAERGPILQTVAIILEGKRKARAPDDARDGKTDPRVGR